MQHRTALATAAVSLVLLTHVIRPVTARSCSRPLSVVSVADTPANGIVVFTVACDVAPCLAGQVPDALPVVDMLTGEEVAGRVSRLIEPESRESTSLWLPDEPLIVNRWYEITWRPQSNGDRAFFSEDYEFVALPPADFDVESRMTVGRLYGIQKASPNSFDCESVFMDSCGGLVDRVSADRAVWPELLITIDDVATDTGLAHAFELRGAFWSDADPPPPFGEPLWGGHRSLEHTFDAAAEQYCYRIELRSLIDGSTALHEACLEHGDIGDVGTFELTTEELANQFARCADPPAGYAAEWCAGTRARCEKAAARGYVDEGCEDIESRCPESDVPPSPPEMEPDAGSPDDEPAAIRDDGGTEADDDAEHSGGTSDSADTHESSGTDVDGHMSRGCSVRAGAESGPAGLLAILCVVLGMRRAQRRAAVHRNMANAQSSP